MLLLNNLLCEVLNLINIGSSKLLGLNSGLLLTWRLKIEISHTSDWSLFLARLIDAESIWGCVIRASLCCHKSIVFLCRDLLLLLKHDFIDLLWCIILLRITHLHAVYIKRFCSHWWLSTKISWGLAVAAFRNTRVLSRLKIHLLSWVWFKVVLQSALSTRGNSTTWSSREVRSVSVAWMYLIIPVLTSISSKIKEILFTSLE